MNAKGQAIEKSANFATGERHDLDKQRPDELNYRALGNGPVRTRIGQQVCSGRRAGTHNAQTLGLREDTTGRTTHGARRLCGTAN